MAFEQEFLSWIEENHPDEHYECFDIVPFAREAYRAITKPVANGPSPLLHLEVYENIFRRTGSLEKAYYNLVSDYDVNRVLIQSAPSFGNINREYILENATIKLVDPALHPDIAKRYPHIDYAGFVGIPVIESTVNDETGTLYLTEDLIKSRGLTSDEVLAAAKENIKPQLRKINSLVYGAVNGEFSTVISADDIDDVIKKAAFPMIIITNESRSYGASSIMDDNLLAKIAESYNGDFVILPSSVHEVITAPAGAKSPEELARIISDVNDEMTPIDDRLSYTPRIYNRLEKTITVYGGPENRRTQHV